MGAKNWSKAVLSLLLWTWGGCLYFYIEVLWKSLRGHPEKISWTMLTLAIILCIPLERCGAELPWSCPLWGQALICSCAVTAAEFAAGLILNVWLGLGVWDYSNMWGNILGQICPQFFAVWIVLCFIIIPVFDWMRYCVAGGEKPTYCFKIRKQA